MCQLPINRFHKRIGPEPAPPRPRFKTSVPVLNEISVTDQFIPFQPSKPFGGNGGGCCIHLFHQIRLGFMNNNTMPPTSMSAPTAGGMKWLSEVAMCIPRRLMGWPGVEKLRPD